MERAMVVGARENREKNIVVVVANLKASRQQQIVFCTILRQTLTNSYQEWKIFECKCERSNYVVKSNYEFPVLIYLTSSVRYVSSITYTS